MRMLAAGFLLMTGAALAEGPPAVPALPEPAIESGSSGPEIVKRSLKEEPAPTRRPANEEEARRRLMVLLMMRDAAGGHPATLLRPAE
jgi:hypothetical protein